MSLLQVTSCGRQIDLAIAQALSITLEDEGVGADVSLPVCDGSMTVSPTNLPWPYFLFQAGEQGVWYDPSDLSSMFQDSAGTIPVTAVGQAVGRIKDKSGRGYHATQATPTSRPILRQDLSGRYYLEFDGVDDRMTAGTLALAVNKVQMFAGLHKASDAAVGVPFEYGANATTTAGTFGILAPGSAASATFQFLNRGATTTQTVTSTADRAAPITQVVCGIGDLAAPSAELRLNGVTNTTVTTATGGGNYAVRFLFIGARGGTSSHFNGRLYGLIIRFSASNLDAASIANTETWINAKTGAY